MTYRLPKYQVYYDPDTKQWIVSSKEVHMSVADDFPMAAMAKFYMMFQSICHEEEGPQTEDLEKLRVL